jgi:hypothetical protein
MSTPGLENEDLVENIPVSVENRVCAGVISVNFCVLRYRIVLIIKRRCTAMAVVEILYSLSTLLST